MVDRRTFMASLGAATAGAVVPCRLAAAGSAKSGYVEARDYRKMAESAVQCVRCPRECVIPPLERGYCGSRENRAGTLYSLVYGHPVAQNVDPIEKKPFFHFLPGSRTYSLATTGCNLNCKFCQNWEISQIRPEEAPVPYVSPATIARAARNEGCRSIAFTYNEPTTYAEYEEDCAAEGRAQGMKSISISNGYIKKEPLLRLCKKLDAMKVDLKSFREKYYREVCSGELKPVLDTIVTLRQEKLWNELVVLVVPGLNDSTQEFRDMSAWIRRELGPDVPVHFTRFSPNYRLKNLPPTPVEVLETAWNEAKNAGLRYVYVGNVPGHERENTFCHSCGKKIISRYIFWVKEMNIKNGACAFCGQKIPGVWV